MSIKEFHQLPHSKYAVFKCEIGEDENLMGLIQSFYVDLILQNNIEEVIGIFHVINHEKKSTKNYVMAPTVTEEYTELSNNTDKCNAMITGDPIKKYQIKLENGVLSVRNT